MLGQRYTQKPSDRWLDREERESAFDIMSPTGRNRPFKGIHLPSKKMSINPDGPQSSFSNTTAGNNSARVEREQAWGMDATLAEVHAPHNMNGIAYAFAKGPGGQTPFPTLVVMSDYFPQSQHSQPQVTDGSSFSSQAPQPRKTHARKPSTTASPVPQKFVSSKYPTQEKEEPSWKDGANLEPSSKIRETMA
ncbi:hypothetical protein BGX27_000056 [Mortierella sp. AM989]|nr:hypothetical protein BGX27_000056 [Mortierella sp. AM989]